MLLGQALCNAVARGPNDLAIIDGDRRLTYSQFNARVNRIAHTLVDAGIERGDRVVVCMRNREETVSTYFALQKLGAVYAPVNFRLTPGEVLTCIKKVRPKLVVFEERTRNTIANLRQEVACERYLYVDTDPPDWAEPFEDRIARASDAEPVASVSENDLSLIFFTSGTTGQPKGVPRTHRAEYSATMANIIAMRWQFWERALGIMPLYHTMGVRTILSMAFLSGAFVIVRDFQPEEVLRVIEADRVTSVFLVPTMYHALLRSPEFERRDMSSLRSAGYAGMTMQDALNREILERMRPPLFINIFGTSEIYCFAYCDYIDRKPNCIGRPSIHQQLRVVVADPSRRVGPTETVPVGELGEIITRADADDAFHGYWESPEDTEKVIRNGWYFTRDLGYQDEDGDFYLVGRVDDTIISGGENIHPLEVENVLMGCPGVREVAVVGTPDEHWGQVVTAFIVRNTSDLTAEAVDGFCRQSAELAAFKRPRRVYFVDEIPKSPVGKVLRRVLQTRPLPDVG